MPQAPPPSGLRVGRVFDIPIYLHSSWFIIFALITFSLGTQFTAPHPHWGPQQRWSLVSSRASCFFASVIFHELAHSIVARHYRIPVGSITLFVFGGFSHIDREPNSALQEFNIAIAGPLSSLFLAGLLLSGLAVCPHLGNGYGGHGWLRGINFMLGAFNLVPGFPLDGGRVLRGIVWGVTKSFTRASQIASTSGRAFAYLLIFRGIWRALTGDRVNGLWFAFIGWFLLDAAKESFAQVALRSTLTGVRAEDIMTPEIPTVAREISLEDYIHEVLRTGRRSHMVTGAGIPVGLVTLDSARDVPREEWDNTSVQAAMVPIDRIHSALPDEPVLNVLERMQREDVNQMPVLDSGHIVGMIGRRL